MYWHLNKKTAEPNIFGSIPKVSRHTGISKNSLRYVFSDKKEKEYEDDTHRIVRINTR